MHFVRFVAGVFTQLPVKSCPIGLNKDQLQSSLDNSGPVGLEALRISPFLKLALWHSDIITPKKNYRRLLVAIISPMVGPKDPTDTFGS